MIHEGSEGREGEGGVVVLLRFTEGNYATFQLDQFSSPPLPSEAASFSQQFYSYLTAVTNFHAIFKIYKLWLY